MSKSVETLRDELLAALPSLTPDEIRELSEYVADLNNRRNRREAYRHE